MEHKLDQKKVHRLKGLLTKIMDAGSRTVNWYNDRQEERSFKLYRLPSTQIKMIDENFDALNQLCKLADFYIKKDDKGIYYAMCFGKKERLRDKINEIIED